MCLFLLIASDASFALLAKEAEGVLSNFQILERVSSEAAREIVASFGAGGFIMLNKVKGVGDADFILEDAFIFRMKEAGMRVTALKPQAAAIPADSSAYELSYRIVRMSLSYPKIWRSRWIGSRRVERSAQITVHAQLVDRRTGDVAWVGESQKRYGDTIPHSLLNVVEEKQYEFTRPPRNEHRIAKFVEPVIVAGIVTGLVFLFFSNQKND